MSYVSRREFLVKGGGLACLWLSPLGRQAIVAAEQYSPDNKLQFLTARQRKVLAVITDIIIPGNDTPGAIDAGVPECIEHMLALCMPGNDADEWLWAFSLFAQETRFHQLSKGQQYDVVKAFDDKLAPQHFYRTIKELTVFGYYTSEVGASIELQYDPVPGSYHEVPMENIERAWS